MAAPPRHFLDIDSIPPEAVRAILAEALRRKQARAGLPKGTPDVDAPLKGHALAMIFEKHSTRTRFSFDMAIRQLGGSSIVAGAGDMQLGRGEPIADTARVLSRMVDLIMLRANRHADLVELAAQSSVPVINGLTDRSHPCQILADLLTLVERGVDLSSAKIAWVGDGNNVCASFIHAAGVFGFELAIATPPSYAPKPADLARGQVLAANVSVTHEPSAAVFDADCVVTDTWVSMGDEDADERKLAFAPYQVNDALMALAKPNAVFLHCLPAHRDEEVSTAVIDGPQSLIWDEAENRLHAQKAVLLWCAKGL